MWREIAPIGSVMTPRTNTITEKFQLAVWVGKVNVEANELLYAGAAACCRNVILISSVFPISMALFSEYASNIIVVLPAIVFLLRSRCNLVEFTNWICLSAEYL